VGQVLIVPDSPLTWDTEGNELPPQVVHVIQAGETLSGLSYEYDTPIDAIVAANPDINLDLIYEGQEIVIPLAMPTATPTATTPPTATPSATPRYTAPDLLAPADGRQVIGPVLFFNWTATGWLADDEFYVLHLTWPDGTSGEYWTKSNSRRVDKTERPVPGEVGWRVGIMRRTGVAADGTPMGVTLAEFGEPRTVEWVK
jgi:hypothetical protein